MWISGNSSNDNSLQAVGLSGHSDLQIVVNTSLQTVSSTFSGSESVCNESVCNVTVAVIQESKLSSNSKTPSIQNFTTVRLDSRQGQGGGLLTLIHKSINFSRKHASPETGRTSFGGVDHHGHTGRHRVDHYQRLHTPGKLLGRRLPSISGPSDDDHGYPKTWRLQCTPLCMVLKLDRYKRHPIGEYDIWLQHRYS